MLNMIVVGAIFAILTWAITSISKSYQEIKHLNTRIDMLNKRIAEIDRERAEIANKLRDDFAS